MATVSDSSSATRSRWSGWSRISASTRPAPWRCPLLARLGPVETSRILADAGASMALCSKIDDEVQATVGTVVCTAAGRGVQWSDMLSSDDRDLEETIGPDDIADIMYTSGTTGRPKGVVIRHSGLSTTDRVPSAWLGLGFMSSSPFATTSGSLLVSGPLRGGLSGWFLPRFSADAWVGTVERERPVSAFLVPAMVELIVASSRFGTADLSSLAVVTVGQRADRLGNAAPLRCGLGRRRGPVRVRDDRVRGSHGDADG